ncbi:UNVERIFIED_CONTAM: hypothetical protein PYX00_011416 [Menopon gallinae]|uniref:Uncharacterized protein n=1 Tax=Menopon gallinae TaxID=328185 RepID=A0AAW2H7L1_9NEOP
MIFVGSRPDFLFRSRKKATRRVFTCGLNSEFNVLLYSDHTGVVNGESDKVCFVVPVHYPSFVFSFSPRLSLEKSVDSLFEFASERERDMLYEYVRGIENRNAEKIPFLRSVNMSKIPNYLSPIVTVGAVVHSCAALREHNLGRSLTQLVVPSFIMFFSAPLCANLVYKQAGIDHRVLGSYFLGLALFFLVKDSRLITSSMFVFPTIGRIRLLCDMKNGRESLSSVIAWLMMCEFTGLAVQKIFFGEQATEFSQRNFTDLIGNVLVVASARCLQLSDAYVVLCICFLVFAKKVRERKRDEEGGVPEGAPKIRRHPKRSAAVSGPAEKPPRRKAAARARKAADSK